MKRGAPTDSTASNGKRQSPSSDLDYYSDTPDELGPILETASVGLSAWTETIKKVIKGVVSIHFSNITNFDTELCLTSEATGFVVDAQRGIILTNRHVVGPGPFLGYAVFDNHEEAVVSPIYRDPIHDFGFLKFDPAEIKYMEISEIQLAPQLAKVGTEIRVVGNDAGEKLSILTGFISRLDRNAPYYGTMTYNDFNTEYIQAAASASGGSSGSPVVNEDGHAVALQAGGSSEAATDFFLPVWRPLRALKCIQAEKPITRGDIQVEWVLRPFDECRRLGLTTDAENRARTLFPDRSGLLVAELVVPKGPADGLIKEGDTLISINGEGIATFVRTDEILDEHVGSELEFVIQRGGKEITQKVKIGDLHAITPSRYIEVGGLMFHDLSYQLARSFGIPVEGVFVSAADGAFSVLADGNMCIVDKIDDKPTPNLDVFIDILKDIPDRQKISVSYHPITDLHDKNIAAAHIDRHWRAKMTMATRNDKTGLWDFSTLQEKAPEPSPLEPKFAKFIDIPIANEEKRGCAHITKSLVRVTMTAPILVDNHPWRSDSGFGVVVDAENGYVLVSRRTVPHDACDIYLIFAESIDVPGEVVFLHPNLNYALVKYDPTLVTADVRTPKFAATQLRRGDHAFFVGCNHNHRVVTDDVTVSSVIAQNTAPNYGSPRYRGTNLESIFLDSKIAQECDSGVLLDNDGTVRAFWLAHLGDQNDDELFNVYRTGLDVIDVNDVIASLKQNEIPKHLRMIEAEFCGITLYNGRSRGVPQEWITRFENETTDEVRLLTVFKVGAPQKGGSPCPLKFADLVLTVNDKLVTSIRDLNPQYHQELRLKIVREMQVMDIVVPTVDTSTINTSRILSWCGSLIQAPHLAVRQLMEKIPSEVFVLNKSPGGPTAQYRINTGEFITHVNDQETPDLETFIRVTAGVKDNTYVKLRLVTVNNVPGACSLKTNYHYFPTQEYRKDESGKWQAVRKSHK